MVVEPQLPATASPTQVKEVVQRLTDLKLCSDNHILSAFSSARLDTSKNTTRDTRSPFSGNQDRSLTKQNRKVPSVTSRHKSQVEARVCFLLEAFVLLSLLLCSGPFLLLSFPVMSGSGSSSNSRSGFGSSTRRRRTNGIIHHNDPNRFLDVVFNARSSSPSRGRSRSRTSTGTGTRSRPTSPIPIPNAVPRLRLRGVRRRVSFEEPGAPTAPSVFEYFSGSSSSSSSPSASPSPPSYRSTPSFDYRDFDFDYDFSDNDNEDVDDLAYPITGRPSGGREEERGRTTTARIQSRSRSRSRSREPQSQTNHRVTITHGVRHIYPYHHCNGNRTPPPVPTVPPPLPPLPPPPAFSGFQQEPVRDRIRWLPAPRHIPAPRNVPAPRQFPAPRLIIRQPHSSSLLRRPFQRVRFREPQPFDEDEEEEEGRDLRVTVRTRTRTATTNGTSNGRTGRRRHGDFDDDDEDERTTTVTTTTYYNVDEDTDRMPRAAWGVLFDADERPTERLREVLAALGRWVVSISPFFSLPTREMELL